MSRDIWSRDGCRPLGTQEAGPLPCWLFALSRRLPNPAPIPAPVPESRAAPVPPAPERRPIMLEQSPPWLTLVAPVVTWC